MKQVCEIRDYHPQWNPNSRGAGQRGAHWAVLRKRKKIDEQTAWASAKQAGWTFVPGRVKLTITFVYARTVRVDIDNLYSRCKGLLDGLKGEFFEDDDVAHLDLRVDATVEKGVKALRLELEAACRRIR